MNKNDEFWKRVDKELELTQRKKEKEERIREEERKKTKNRETTFKIFGVIALFIIANYLFFYVGDKMRHFLESLFY